MKRTHDDNSWYEDSYPSYVETVWDLLEEEIPLDKLPDDETISSITRSTAHESSSDVSPDYDADKYNTVIIHIPIPSEFLSFICGRCYAAFNQENKLTEHLQTHKKKDRLADYVQVICSHCSGTFQAKKFEKHIIKHTKFTNCLHVICNTCQQTYQLTEFKKHHTKPARPRKGRWHVITAMQAASKKQHFNNGTTAHHEYQTICAQYAHQRINFF
ncbi:MAG TPA: hypothetical protein PLU71_02950 [Candidatus Dependentiae bacterium]|nr:hypothetical protein [Candidatus Dependentiae bacterium]HRQ62789.1 hypothetical protein [Candidatus Dependentiae bacterium]